MTRTIPWDTPQLSAGEWEEKGAERWQSLSVADAAYFAQVSPQTIYKWIEWGWLKENDHYEYIPLFRAYRWDMHRLYELMSLGKTGRKQLKKNIPGDKQPQKMIQDILDYGWDDNDIIDMSLEEAATLVGVSKSQIYRMIENGYLAPGREITDGVDTMYAFIMGAFVRAIDDWKATYAERKLRKPAPKEDDENKPSRRIRRKQQLRTIEDFENGYIPPSERQDLSDIAAIRLQERAEKGTARLMGNKSFRGRPSILKQLETKQNKVESVVSDTP